MSYVAELVERLLIILIRTGDDCCLEGEGLGRLLCVLSMCLFGLVGLRRFG